MARRILLLLAAVLIAIAGCGAVFAYANQADARALAGTKSIKALVVTKSIDAGTPVNSLTGDDTRLESLPAMSTPKGSFASLSVVKGKVTATMLVPGQVLTAEMFTAAKPKAAATVLPVPAGKMAVSLALADPNRVGGYLKPGNEVAVFDTFNAAEGSAPGPKTPSGNGTNDDFKYNRSTRLVLPRVRVLAIGDEAFGTSFKPTTTAANNGAITVTLAVDQQQAEKLIQVAQVGQPWLALLTDTSKTAPSDGVDDRGLFR